MPRALDNIIAVSERAIVAVIARHPRAANWPPRVAPRHFEVMSTVSLHCFDLYNKRTDYAA